MGRHLLLTSRSNPKIKFIEGLRNSKERKATELFLVEGEREISRAKGIVTVVYHEKSPLIEEIEKKGGELIHVSKGLLEKMTLRGEVLAVGRQEKKGLSSLKGSFFVALVGIEKAGNIGAILRTCDGCGVDGVLLVDSLSDHYHPHAIRASLGASFSLNIVSCSTKEAFAFIDEKNLELIVTSPEAKDNYCTRSLQGKVMIAFGQEDKGLNNDWMKGAKVFIPMKGVCDSLNVSVAAGIVLYERLRQDES